VEDTEISEQLAESDRSFSNKIFRIPDFRDDPIDLQSDHYHYTGMLSLKLLPEEQSAPGSLNF